MKWFNGNLKTKCNVIMICCMLLLLSYVLSVNCKNELTGTSGSPNINPPNRPTWLSWLVPGNNLRLPDLLVEPPPPRPRPRGNGRVGDDYIPPEQPTPEQPTPEPPDGEPHNGETRRLLYRRVNRRHSRGPQLSWYFPYKYL